MREEYEVEMQRKIMNQTKKDINNSNKGKGESKSKVAMGLERMYEDE